MTENQGYSCSSRHKGSSFSDTWVPRCPFFCQWGSGHHKRAFWASKHLQKHLSTLIQPYTTARYQISKKLYILKYCLIELKCVKFIECLSCFHFPSPEPSMILYIAFVCDHISLINFNLKLSLSLLMWLKFLRADISHGVKGQLIWVLLFLGDSYLRLIHLCQKRWCQHLANFAMISMGLVCTNMGKINSGYLKW